MLDASVLVKWILQDDESEPDTAQALALCKKFREGHISLVQPVHWLAEVAAVCVRLKPSIAMAATTFLGCDDGVAQTICSATVRIAGSSGAPILCPATAFEHQEASWRG